MSMQEEVQLRHEMNRGEQSRELLDNPLIKEFFEENEKEIWNLIKTSPIKDVEGREKLLMILRSMEKFKGYLTQTLETGKMASLSLEYKRSSIQKAKDWIFDN